MNEEGPTLSFDPEWLAITRAFHPWLSTTRHQPAFPDEAEARALVAQELKWVRENVPTNERGEMLVKECQSFATTAPGPGREGGDKFRQRRSWFSFGALCLCSLPFYCFFHIDFWCFFLRERLFFLCIFFHFHAPKMPLVFH